MHLADSAEDEILEAPPNPESKNYYYLYYPIAYKCQQNIIYRFQEVNQTFSSPIQ